MTPHHLGFWGDVRTSLVHIARAGIHTSSPETRGGKIGALVIVPHPGKLEGSGGVEVQDGFLQDPEACQGFDHWIDIPLHTGGKVGGMLVDKHPGEHRSQVGDAGQAQGGGINGSSPLILSNYARSAVPVTRVFPSAR